MPPKKKKANVAKPKKPTKTWAKKLAQSKGGTPEFQVMVAHFLLDLSERVYYGSSPTLAKAYQTVSMQTHPDKQTGDVAKQQALTSAYDYLKGFIKRTYSDINTHTH